MLAVEAGAEPVVIIDGDDGEWIENGSQVILESRSMVREVRAVKDESYLYLRLVLDEEFTDVRTLAIGVDVLEGGGGGLPGQPGVDPEGDYAVTLEADRGQMWVGASNDPHAIINGSVLGFFEVQSDDLLEGSGVWHPQQLIVNRPYTIPGTAEQFEMEMFGVGEMIEGDLRPGRSGVRLQSDLGSRGRHRRVATALPGHRVLGPIILGGIPDRARRRNHHRACREGWDHGCG